MGHSRCHRWAVVLAEGGAQRLQPLTRRIAGDDRPKQVCAVLGGQTLSHQTLLRTGRLAPTVPAIPYSLMCLHNIDARAVAAFFPSDHHFSDHAAFLDHMKIAFQAAESHPGSVVLLGAKAATPESGYGWIEPGDVVRIAYPDPCDASRVFGKSPILRAASALMNRG
jgi:mannose-1-phosphate guanylyltransferase